jgi:hypothetical protein
MLFIQ